MKRLSTLIKQLDKLEDEIYKFPPKDIVKTIERLEKQGKIKSKIDDLVYVVYSGANIDVEIDKVLSGK